MSCFCVRLHLHQRRWSICRGPIQLVEARVPRIFIPRELRRLYNRCRSFVVMRGPLCSLVDRGYSVPRAPAAVTSATLPCLLAGWWGIKNEGRSGTRRARRGRDCVTEADRQPASARFRFRVRSRGPRESPKLLLFLFYSC